MDGADDDDDDEEDAISVSSAAPRPETAFLTTPFLDTTIYAHASLVATTTKNKKGEEETTYTMADVTKPPKVPARLKDIKQELAS